MVISPNKWELDVQGYLNTCNITSATPRKQIRDFAAGINDLGLWNSMVCWPLRSSQNAGTGTTAFSLGGLGTYNGTLVNGPTWGADGVTFDGTNDYINSDNVSFPAEFTFFVINKNNAAAKASRPLIATASGTLNTNLHFGHSFVGTVYGVLWAQATGQQKPTNSSLATAALGVFDGGAVGYSAGSVEFCKNGGTLNVVADSPTTALVAEQKTVQIGGGTQNAQYFNGQIPFASLTAVKMTQGQHADLYALYRNTLGTGLGLP